MEFKRNTIELAKHHKKYCEGEFCTISLWSLKVMAEKAGVRFTREEIKLFI